MKLFSTSFSFILLFSAIVPSIALSNRYKSNNKVRSPQWQGWEYFSHNTKQYRQRKHEKSAQKDRKSKGKYQKNSSK